MSPLQFLDNLFNSAFFKTNHFLLTEWSWRVERQQRPLVALGELGLACTFILKSPDAVGVGGLERFRFFGRLDDETP